MKKRIITLLAILAVMVACIAFSAQADPYVSAIDWTQECPCGCKATLADVEWTEWNDGDAFAAGGHYLVTGAAFTDCPNWGNGTGNLTILLRSTADPAVEPSAVTVSMTGSKQFSHASNYVKGKVSIIGEKATITSDIANANGGFFRVQASAGVLNIMGDVTLEGDATGNEHSGGFLFINNGTINMKGVTLRNAHGKNGGVLYIYNGSANFEDCVFENCSATQNGGAISSVTTSTNTVTLTNCTFTGCTAGSSNSGGAIYASVGTVTMSGCTFTECSAQYGGAVAVGGATVNMTECEVTDCSAAYGGFANVSGGKLNLKTGTVISGCSATTLADHVRVSGGTVYMEGADITTDGEGTRGSGVYVEKGTLRITSTSDVLGVNGERVGNIAVAKYTDTTTSKVELSTAWKGEASIELFTKADGETVDLVPGATSYNANITIVKYESSAWQPATASTSLPDATLWAESPNTENPQINGWTNYIMPYRTQVVYADGTKEWFVDNRAAAYNAASAPGAFLRPWTTRNMSGDTAITRTTYVDVSLAVPGNFAFSSSAPEGTKLYLFDSSVAAPNVSTKAPATTIAEPVTKIDGKTYVVIPGETTSAIYPIEVTEAKLTGVTLRPGASGLYFSASSAVNAHADVKDLICTGVAVSLKAIEDAKDTAWTAKIGSTGNGILVQNIMKDTADGDRSETKIYAEACVSYGGSVIALGDENVAITLNDLMGALKTEIEEGKELTEAQKTPLVEFVSKWNAKFDVWADLLAELSE